MSTTNYQFVSIKNKYQCDCGEYKFRVKLSKYGNSFVFDKTVQIKECKGFICSDRGTCIILITRKGSKHVYNSERLSLNEIINNCNRQIQEQLEKIYDVGGSKYIESEKKIESLATLNVKFK